MKMNSCKQSLYQLTLRFSRFSFSNKKRVNGFCKRFLSSQSSINEEIIIPNRIQRSSTDILKALASTVQQDETAAHYKYHDDPFLIPTSNPTKRSYALSKESGKRAARWIRQEHADLFNHKDCDPPIEAFFPRPIYKEGDDVNEDILKNTIQNLFVADSVTVYELLQSKHESISRETKQALLELVCFYNGEECTDSELMEETWFKQVNKDRRKLYWKDRGFADSLFMEMNPPDELSYNTYLQGLAKYRQAEKAWAVYEEIKVKNITIFTETYNRLIALTVSLKQGFEQRWELVQSFLKEMAEKKIKPNLHTLNAVLEVLSITHPQKLSKSAALNVIAEFHKLGIEPCLTSYYYLLITFYKESGPVSSILQDIMDNIEDREFEIEDVKDSFFFVSAMDICRNFLKDIQLAYRVHKLLHIGENYNLLGDSFKESIYYRNFFFLLCSCESLEVLMQYYNTLAPHVYIPEPSVMEEILKVVNLNGAGELFPRLWSDIKMFDHTGRENLLQAILAGMVENSQPGNEERCKEFALVATDVWSKIQSQENLRDQKFNTLNWTGRMLGEVMILWLRAGMKTEVQLVMKKLERDSHNIIGELDVMHLSEYIDTCITDGDIDAAIKCVKYSSSCGFPEAEDQAMKVKSSLPLDDFYLTKLSNAIGKDLSKLKDSDSTS